MDFSAPAIHCGGFEIRRTYIKEELKLNLGLADLPELLRRSGVKALHRKSVKQQKGPTEKWSGVTGHARYHRNGIRRYFTRF